MTKRSPQKKGKLIQIPPALQAALGAVRGDAFVTEVTQDVFSISAQIRKERGTLKTGNMVEGEGIFLCQWRPKDRGGRSLRKTYNVFAAPEDLKDEQGNYSLSTYTDTRTHIAILENWHGYKGRPYVDDMYLYEDLKDDLYHGEWIIPPMDLLYGRDPYTAFPELEHNLVKDQVTGAFNGSFAKSHYNTLSYAWYWSSTKTGAHILAVNLKTGSYVDEKRNQHKFRCRPVRLVKVKSR